MDDTQRHIISEINLPLVCLLESYLEGSGSLASGAIQAIQEYCQRFGVTTLDVDMTPPRPFEVMKALQDEDYARKQATVEGDNGS